MRMSTDRAIRVLLVTHDDTLTRSLEREGFEVHQVSESEDVYSLVGELEPDAILIRPDSPTRDSLEHLASQSCKHPQPTLFLHDKLPQELRQQALSLGVSSYATAELTTTALRSLIEISIDHAKRLQAVKRELTRNQKTLAERKQVDQAKRILWKDHGMSEETAYKALKTMAMNGRISVADAARKVLESKEKQA